MEEVLADSTAAAGGVLLGGLGPVQGSHRRKLLDDEDLVHRHLHLGEGDRGLLRLSEGFRAPRQGGGHATRPAAFEVVFEEGARLG